MSNPLRGLLFACCFVVFLAGPVSAELQWSVLSQQKLAKTPLDMALSQADQRLFVLLEGGEIQVYSAEGALQETFNVGVAATALAVSPDGRRLFLSDAKGRQLRVVEISYVFDLPVGQSPVKGAAGAPVTITIFDDFQCPYCARLAPLLDQILAAYPGQVRLVFKHFPLRMHNFAQLAALASLAAREQGKFWEMHDQLFANFSQLSEQKIRSLAEKIGLNMQRFDQDLKNPALAQEIATDMQLGLQAGVRGTPSVFINGKLLQERSVPGFRLTIDQELARLRR